MTGNGRDREYDIVLISADGEIIRNLTSGFDQSMGFEYLATPGRPLELGAVDVVVAAGRSPRLLRAHEKDRSLIVQNVVYEDRCASR